MFSSRTHAAFAAIIAAVLIAAVPGTLPAHAQTDPFYKGKRLTLLINFAAAAAVDALRRAVERLNGDAEFAKDAQKSLQFVPHYVTGGDLNARVRRTLVVRSEVRKFVTDYIKNPPK